MKGINLQFDTLLQFIEKNSNNDELLKSRDSFELVYEKVTQQALKIVGLVFDNLVDDVTLKMSFHKMTRELKAFLALKPVVEEEQDEFFNHQFDEVQHFMNNRKPVMPEIDNSQRGDIVKFLFQAQNKEKDIEEFMGNIKNIGGFSTAVKRLKTIKNLNPVITEDIETQTNMNMVYFEKLQKRMPSLFKMDDPTAKCNSQDPNSIDTRSDTSTFDLDAQIQEMIRQKVKEAEEIAEAQKLEKQKQKQQREKQKQLEKEKTKSEKQQKQLKKKKSQLPAKRNSQLGKRNSSAAAHNNSFKAKSGFSMDKTNKKNLISIVEEKQQKKQEKTAANTAQKFENLGIQDTQCDKQPSNKDLKDSSKEFKGQVVADSAKIQSAMPSFDQIFSSLAGIKGIEGISEQQLKIIYESIRSSTTQNLMKSSFFTKPVSFEKQCNTNVTYTQNIVTDELGNIIQGGYENESSTKRKKGKILKKTTSNWNEDKADPNQISIDSEGNAELTNELSGGKYKSKSKGVKYEGEYVRGTPNELLTEPSECKSGIGMDLEARTTNSNGFTRNGLPNISKHIESGEIVNKVEQSDSVTKLLKEGKSAEDFLKKLKDSKNLKPLKETKSLNKENYNLDMYKSKFDSNKIRASEHTNLPSLKRDFSNNPKAGISLHEEGLKSPYLKKSNTTSNDPLFPSTFTQSEGFYKKGQKGERSKEISKEEEKIMKELERIIKEGAVKNNLKHIAMYVQFVESVHIRKCGQRCVHLERFYEFLRKNNLPNRKELILHRTDMNVNMI